MAKKSLGQHFLKNTSAIKTIVQTLSLHPGETVVEIGPGHGEVTSLLAESGARIIVIEKDAELAAGLKKKFEGSLVDIIGGDALDILPELAAKNPRSMRGDWCLVGNIPYYITGHLLRIIGEMPQEVMPKRCVFTIQREVAERIVSAAPNMNRLAASVAYWADTKIIATLSREDFSPVPKVASAIILLERKSVPAFFDGERYYAAVRSVFSQPRKTILNNLSQNIDADGEKLTGKAKETVAEDLRKLGVLPESRPQDLTIGDIAKIAEIFF